MAQEHPSQGSRFPGAPLLLQIPLLDWPYGFEGANAAFGFHSPSMQQSILWNASVTQLGVQSLDWLWGRAGWSGFWTEFGFWASLGVFTYFSSYLPLGEAWMHEEGHRAILTRHGAESHNGVYDYDIGASLIKVDEVLDEDLAALKAEHPADFVRLMSAGIETEVESHRRMRQNNFFLGRSSRHDRFVWWVEGINVSFYLAACANGWIDEDLRAEEAEEADMADRDFTGPDFTAWIYDLRRPREPYASGPRSRPHPSGGGGVSRYIATADLEEEERDYLRLQAILSLLNFTSPQLWGPDWLPGVWPWGGQGVLWNAGLVHHLTPFGYQIGGDLLLRRGKWSWIFTVQAFASSNLLLPGLRAELLRYPLLVGRKEIRLTGAVSAWVQPEDQLFEAVGARPGAALLGGLAVPFGGGLEVWAEADAKSEGWVPGNVYLDPAFQARGGLAWKL